MTWADTFSLIWTDLKSVAWLEWAKVVFDLLKGIAWPVAVFLIVWIFRTQLRERMRDLISAGVTGAVFQAPSQLILKSEFKFESHPLQSVVKLQEQLKVDFDDFSEDVREAKLLRSLAETRVERVFETIYWNIFASQIAFLRKLLLQPVTHVDTLEYFAETVQPINKEFYANATAPEWTKFLFVQNLVLSTNDKVEITDLGKDFLIYIDVTKAGFERFN